MGMTKPKPKRKQHNLGKHNNSNNEINDTMLDRRLQ